MTFTPEEITAMAREAGAADIIVNGKYTSWIGTQTTDFLERFATLVAEKAAARANESCAVLALDKAGTTDYDYSTCINLADAIRARGQKEGA